jgi:hypothetical protein
MDDQLKSIIALGRDQLDTAVPNPAVYGRILKELEGRKRKKRMVRMVTGVSLSGIAAVLLIGFFVNVFEKHQENHPEAAGVNNIIKKPEIKQTIIDSSGTVDHVIAEADKLNDQNENAVRFLTHLKQEYAFQISASPSKRLTSIYAIERQHKVDKALTDALFEVLNNDPNANVRMAALDVLSAKMHDAAIRKRLVYTMVNQDEPMVQLMMIQLFSNARESDFIEKLGQIIDDSQTEQGVREEARFLFAQYTKNLN